MIDHIKEQIMHDNVYEEEEDAVSEWAQKKSK
jgi:hypothetical protein